MVLNLQRRWSNGEMAARRKMDQIVPVMLVGIPSHQGP